MNKLDRNSQNLLSLFKTKKVLLISTIIPFILITLLLIIWILVNLGIKQNIKDLQNSTNFAWLNKVPNVLLTTTIGLSSLFVLINLVISIILLKKANKLDDSGNRNTYIIMTIINMFIPIGIFLVVSILILKKELEENNLDIDEDYSELMNI